MSFSRNEVVLLPIPFTDLTSRKVRPAVVVGGGGRMGDLFLVPVTSQLANTDVALRDWQAAGLNVACGIKAQIATVDSRLVLKSIGVLSSHDGLALEKQLKLWLAL